jgi:hypothetical protein
MNNSAAAAPRSFSSLAASLFGHVLEEYAQAETDLKGLEPFGKSQELASHAKGLTFESKVLSDFTHKPEAERRDYQVKTVFFLYTSVRYDIVTKSDTYPGNSEIQSVSKVGMRQRK